MFSTCDTEDTFDATYSAYAFGRLRAWTVKLDEMFDRDDRVAAALRRKAAVAMLRARRTEVLQRPQAIALP